MVDCRPWRVLAAVCWYIALAPAPLMLASDIEPQQAAEHLRQRHGLVEISGKVWGLPDEERLRSLLNRLPSLRERIVTVQKELDERIARNEQAWQQAKPVLNGLRAQMSLLSAGDLQRGVLADQLKLLENDVADPAALAGRDPVRSQLARLGQDRCDLARDLVWIRRTSLALAERYRQLAADGEVEKLILSMGPKHRLGPVRNYVADVRQLEEYETLAFAPQAPIYLQSGLVRVTALVEESTCVTLTWSEASDAVTFLPPSAAQSAGIDVSADAPSMTLRIHGRSVVVRQIMLGDLRLGSCHIKSVAAWVLPPDAEDLGAQLASQALSSCRPKLELAMLRLAWPK